MAIDDIVAKIASDAEAEATALLDAAREDADRVSSDAAHRAEADAARAQARAKSEAEREAATMLAAARLSARDSMLATRQAAIAAMLGRVEASLVALPDDRYAALLARELACASLPGGSLQLGTEDADRLRTALPPALAAAGIPAEIGDAPADIARGVVLAGDRVRIEVSPASIVESRRADLEGEIDRALFGEEV
jgi:vacuolar-type H+-ATPase subunit E/Vma4